MKAQEVKEILLDNPEASLDELMKLTKNTRSRDTIRKLRVKLGLPPYQVSSQNVKRANRADVEKDIRVRNLSRKSEVVEKKYELLQDELEEARGMLDAMKAVSKENFYTIPSDRTKYESTATAVAVASDWHWEETVKGDNVNGLNEFNLNIARQRADKFFQNVVRLLDVTSREIHIDTLVLALLGDFINGQLREEAMENNSLQPAEAMIEVWKALGGGIQYILDHSEVNLVIPCHSGNHARMTKKIHHSTEAGNSLEFVMYHMLADRFKGNKRVKFIIPTSYLSYVDVGGFVMRFHHGHAIRYGGGVGGIFVPAYKAIAQWQKARHADLDVFGHFHQTKDGGNFISNGSLIGYNAFAVSIKADFEIPKQSFFLIDHKRKEKTVTTSVFLD